MANNKYLQHLRVFKKLDGWPAGLLGALVLIGIALYGVYTYQNLEREKIMLLSELSESNEEKLALIQTIREKEDVIQSFQGQIKNISSTVGVLEKLSQTDEELLMKYSKVYFLNENYIPSRLELIDEDYLNKGATNTEIHAGVRPYLERLLRHANREDLELRVASAYRSFTTQSALKSSYKVVYGAGANQFSADQGYSEHQLGTAVDFTTVKLGAAFNSFANDPAYKWLRENAHNYGFVLSYPPNNAFYKFEPWHWRYVGVELATKLHDEGKYFYDLDQREIDQYLVKLFD